jgi:hypothetical protein
VVLVIALVIAALLIVGLIYERQQHGSRSRPPAPYRPSPPPRPIPSTPVRDAETVVEASIAAASLPDTSSLDSAAAAESPEGDPEDIDQLIGRLERMSVQMFKKTPKQLADQRSVGELVEEPDPKE